MKAILTYHSVDPSGSVVSVHPDRFRQHVELLAASRTRVLSLEALLQPGCDDGVAITFDDGFVNLAEVAWPVLREEGFPATVFVATDWVGKDNAWDPDDGRIPRLPLMNWDVLADLAREGLEVASHSCSHPRLTRLSDERLAAELSGPLGVIRERCGSVSTAFAYPYGDLDDRVVSAAAEAGYTRAVTTELRTLRPIESDPLRLPRLDAYYLAKPGVMERWGTPALSRYLVFRNAARRLRSSLSRGPLA